MQKSPKQQCPIKKLSGKVNSILYRLNFDDFESLYQLSVFIEQWNGVHPAEKLVHVEFGGEICFQHRPAQHVKNRYGLDVGDIGFEVQAVSSWIGKGN